jgi:hypothetical protein
VSIDVSWQGGLPLDLTATPAQGDTNLYDGQSIIFTVTGADNDCGTGLIYAWYINGVATAVSSSPSYTAHASDFTESSHAYLSCVVWQRDGKRAGDVQWNVQRATFPPEASNITIAAKQAEDGMVHLTVSDAVTGALYADFRGTQQSAPFVTSHTFSGVAAGSYKLSATIEGGTTTWYDGTSFANAQTFAIPELPPVDVSFIAW